MLVGVPAVRVYSGTTGELEEQEDVPPPPKHHGYHKMQKLSKDAVGECLKSATLNVVYYCKDGIWYLKVAIILDQILLDGTS